MLHLSNNSSFQPYPNAMKNRSILIPLYLILISWPTLAQLQDLSSMDPISLNKRGDELLELSELVSTYDSTYMLTDSARIYYQLAKNRSFEVLCMNGLAGVRVNEKKILEAERLNDEAFQKLQFYELEDSFVADFVFNTDGVIHQTKGNFMRSTNALLNILNRQKKLEGTKRYDADLVASARQTIGQNYQRVGDYEKSIQYLEQALEMRLNMKKKNLFKIHRLYQSLGVTHQKLGQFDVAEKWLRKGLSGISTDLTTEERKEQFVKISFHLAEVLRKTERYPEAIVQLESAIHHTVPEQKHLLVNSFEELGFVFLEIGDLEKAEIQFRKTLDIQKDLYAHLDRHPNISLAHLNLAKLYQKQDKYKEVLQHLQEANINNSSAYTPENLYDIPALDQIITPLVGLQVLRLKAEVLKESGHKNQNFATLEKALACYQLTSDLVQRNRRYFEAEASKRKLSGEVIEIYEHAIGLALELYRQDPIPKYLQQAFGFAEANKAAILSEEMQNLAAIGESSLPDSISAREQELSTQINFLKDKILQARENGMEAGEIRSWENQLFAAEENLSRFTRQLEVEYPAYHQAKYSLHQTDLASIRSTLLDSQTGVIEYFVGKEKTYLFLLTEDDIVAEEITDWDTVPEMISSLIELIHYGPDGNSFKEDVVQFSTLASALYEKLLSPILNHDTALLLHALIVIPDDILSYLPFELLLSNATGELSSFSPQQAKYLIQDYSISYAYSTQLLLNQPVRAQHASSTTPLLAYAPSFGTAIAAARESCTSDELYSLQCSQGEVEEISRIWSGEAITGLDATLTSFMEQAAQSRILHLATHACIDENNSERNKIFFSDQALTGIDLQAMKIQPELTILSACNTGTGQLARGEGILSLARDFRLAGSPSTLTSLWSVDDCATSKIMTSFHQHLFQGKSKAEALRAAKLDFLSQADKEQSHPYFWAAFVQYGDTSPLRKAVLPSSLIYAVLALVIGGLLYFVRRRKQSGVPSA